MNYRKSVGFLSFGHRQIFFFYEHEEGGFKCLKNATLKSIFRIQS